MDRDPLARLLLVKDLNRDSLNYYTLRRLEHLRCTLLWAGSMGIKQGLSNIVAACKLSQMADVSVLWVLVGDGEARSSLEAEVKVVKNTVIPSKLLTYMAAGLPVLAAINADSQAMQLLRESGGGVIVEPENPAALIEGLKGLMGDKKVRVEMGARNRTYAVEHFDRKKVLKTQETFLTDVVG